MSSVGTEEKERLSLTDDDDDVDDDSDLPVLQGTLCKWTNYIHGWQDRFIVLKEGTLSYYKSENDTAFGCRGAVSLTKAVVTPHEFDECRFDVAVNDCLWYLRAQNAGERQSWIDSLDIHRAESGYGSENSLRRHGSMLSLTSTTSLSTTSASSFKRGRGLNEKLAEMETFRDILCRQVETLQNYFDTCASAITNNTIHDLHDDIDDVDDFDSPQTNGAANPHSPSSLPGAFTSKADIASILQQHGAHAIDFKGEAFTFKATTAGILATLGHCIELMGQREEQWRKRVEKEIDKRKRLQEAYKTALSEKSRPIILGGPDFEEGPHSALNEDEFFDAIDATLDKLEREEERKQKSKVEREKITKPPTTSLDPIHPLYEEINKNVKDHVIHADMAASDILATWQLLAEDGEMKVYKRELEENGMVVDPLKAVHTVKGITGHELCHYFWDPHYRMEWEGTLESTSTIDYLSKDTVVTYQIHKRVWPSTQRDSLFWSTIRHCPPGEDEEGPDLWMVVNKSTEHSDAPNNSKFVRIRFNVAMICQTVVQPPSDGKEITRDNISCKIQYSANVNPGGWAPASVVRVISKRELPKFLKTFTVYVQDKTREKTIMF